MAFWYNFGFAKLNVTLYFFVLDRSYASVIQSGLFILLRWIRLGEMDPPHGLLEEFLKWICMFTGYEFAFAPSKISATKLDYSNTCLKQMNKRKLKKLEQHY